VTPIGIRVVQLVTADPDAAPCPTCGQVSTSGKEWSSTRPRDLPVGGAAVLVQWRKRRWRWRTVDCPRGSLLPFVLSCSDAGSGPLQPDIYGTACSLHASARAAADGSRASSLTAARTRRPTGR
jgi:hypothetical protein